MSQTKKQNSESLRSHPIMSKFPKVELHRHLEGTFHIPTLYDIAQKNNIEVPSTLDEFYKSVQFPKDSPPDFLAFLSKFRNDWYRNFEDIRRITYDSLVKMAKEGIFYTEIRFSPEHFSLQNNFNRMEVAQLVMETGQKAAKDGGFLLNYLITFNRSKQTEVEMLELYEQIKTLNHPNIVGIDLAGDEVNFPPELFKNFFAKVHEDGLFGITVHAGEVSPSIQIWNAIDLLHAKRIGHGTAAINDKKLQKKLIDEGITLEQCMTSNFQTGSWVDSPNHPLGRLFRLNVPVTINTDDPHIQNCDLTDEYIKAATYFDFSIEDFIAINLIAINGAFLSDKDKKQLHKSYLKAVDSFRKEAGI